MNSEIIKLASNWTQAKNGSIPQLDPAYYCATRDVFQARLDSMKQLWFMPGIFFWYDLDTKTIVLADRGQGILTTLKKVKPELANDQQALETAFKEKLSGRAPENRGNGLKFVRQTVSDQKLQLNFYSGMAQAELNEGMLIESTQQLVQGCLAILRF